MTTDLKVLIVDDSRIFRSMIEKILVNEKHIQVVGSVRNGALAIEFIKSNPVDLVTLDLEMPEMGGLETLRAIQEINREDAGMFGNVVSARPRAENECHNSIGVIMVSSFTHKGADITIQALEEGAFDFITKSEYEKVEDNIASLQRQLVVKLRNFSTNRLNRNKVLPVFKTKDIVKQNVVSARPRAESLSDLKVKAILIGVSTGGPKALLQILPDLSEKVDLPILIVQHMPPTFTQSLANSLDTKCRHKVIESRHNDIVKNDHIYIAPGGKHVEIKRDANRNAITVLTDNVPENGCRPSVDVLFRSGANVFGGNLIAIVLTGMGCDGTKGLEPIKQAGAHVIAQDEKTSVVWGMPGSAANAGLVDSILPLGEIPEAVRAIVQGK